MAFGDEILEWKRAIKEQQPVERTECPDCGWSLEKTEDGRLHCKFCGYTEGLSINRR